MRAGLSPGSGRRRSCGRMSAARRSARRSVRTSCPDSRIAPAQGSYSRTASLRIVDLPEPFAPTITHSWPGASVKETVSSASWSEPG